MVDRGKIRLESMRVGRQEGLCICKTLEELEVGLGLLVTEHKGKGGYGFILG